MDLNFFFVDYLTTHCYQFPVVCEHQVQDVVLSGGLLNELDHEKLFYKLYQVQSLLLVLCHRSSISWEGCSSFQCFHYFSYQVVKKAKVEFPDISMVGEALCPFSSVTQWCSLWAPYLFKPATCSTIYLMNDDSNYRTAQASPGSVKKLNCSPRRVYLFVDL